MPVQDTALTRALKRWYQRVVQTQPPKRELATGAAGTNDGDRARHRRPSGGTAKGTKRSARKRPRPRRKKRPRA